MRWPVLTFFLLLCIPKANAIEAVVVHTLFYRSDTVQQGKLTPSIEIYWQVNPNTLHYATTPEKIISGKIKTDILLYNESGIIKHDQYILLTYPIKSVDELLDHDIIDMRRYNLPTGLVKLKFVLTDAIDSVNKFTFTDSFTVSPPANNYFYSGLQLLDTVYKSNSESAFWKNREQHIPFCSNFLGDNRRMIYYYAELYGAGKSSAKDYPLVQKIVISKNETEGSYGDLVHIDTILNQQTFLPLVGKFNISTLPSGNYYLRVTLENQAHEVIANETLFFQRLNKHPFIEDTFKKTAAINDTGIENVSVLNLKKTFVAKYSMGQIRAILKMLLPFSDQTGIQTINGFLKKPDELYMRYYIYNYFANINKDDPARAWKEFSSKITEVNKLFNTGTTPGYETERGYIYLRYGAPTDIITVENEQGTLPYEVWQYNTLMQLNKKDIPDAIFLFYKPNHMTTDYKLLHSTVVGELQNLQWRSTLYTNGQGGDNSNSRAEQYLGNR